MVAQDFPAQSERRGFLKKVCAAGIGLIAGLVPVGSGLLVLLDPLRRKSDNRDAVLVASLNALPADGVPRKFPVIASQIDGWNRSPNVPVGAVYLRRTGEKSVQALNVVCPHAGCFVDFKPDRKSYFCPCHNSAFALDGQISDPKSPSPRAMDDLEVEVRNDHEIWVKFRNYRAGEKAKVPV